MDDMERRARVNRRRVSRNGRRVTDPATPPVDNSLEVGLTGAVPAQEILETFGAGARLTSTVVGSAERLAPPDHTSTRGPSND
jgi:hypothetical protein